MGLDGDDRQPGLPRKTKRGDQWEERRDIGGGDGDKGKKHPRASRPGTTEHNEKEKSRPSSRRNLRNGQVMTGHGEGKMRTPNCDERGTEGRSQHNRLKNLAAKEGG